MGKQPIIEKIQTWLNETYKDSPGYNPIEVTGLPGWDTTNAMLIAYQIEDGVSTSIINNETSSGIYDFTGEGFSPISSSTDFSIQSNKNRLMILQGAFYVKGINPGAFGPTYNTEFSSAVSTLQSNAGIGATGVADLLVVKALLSMDAFTVLPQYGGVETIATIQRTLNAEYANDMGSLIPCDGVYGRDLNKALIYALQIQEGFSVAEANEADGYFSPGTQSKCPTLSLGDANIFVTLLKYALYCNGYTDIDISSDVFDQVTQTAIYEVQSFLGLNRTGEAGVDTWMALLLSSGNPNMSVTGCDVSQTLSEEDAKILKNNGYDIVGRYISGEFATSVEELTNILNAGLNVFPIYETGSYQTSYFSTEQGTSDAIAAVEECRSLGIPEGTTIYFTVDYDMEGYQITSLVLPYFEAIYNKFNNAQFNYKIGIYGSRNVCSQVINAGYAQLAFVDGASTGYSGNMGFEMPKQWAFNQIKEGVTVGGIQVDNDQVSGRDLGFNSLEKGGEATVINKSNTGVNLPSDLQQFNKDIGTLMFDVLQEFLNNVGFQIFTSGSEFKDDDIPKSLNKYFTSLETGILATKVYTQPWYIPKGSDAAYIRLELGFTPDIGQGEYMTIYHNKDSQNMDALIFDGVGFNFSNADLNALEKAPGLKSAFNILIPIISESNYHVELYPYWQPDDGTIEGFYEFGCTYGYQITMENLLDLAEKFNNGSDSVLPNKVVNFFLENIGQFVYINLIVGINEKDRIIDYIVKTANTLFTTIITFLLIEMLNSEAIQIENEAIIGITEAGKIFIDSFEGLKGLLEIAVSALGGLIETNPEIFVFACC